MENRIKIWYLYHSGFAVRVDGKLLIFDYYSNRAANDEDSLYNGIFEPAAHSGESVFVFSSHKHRDHFNPVILQWEKQIPGIRYILSSDIPVRRRNTNMLIAEPEKHYCFSDINIETYASTDEGVAFLVRTGRTTLYHAGDLHWWHWEGEPDLWNGNMEKQYKQQIAKIKKAAIDVAFLPVDPRQEEFSTLGAGWFLKEIACSHVFPMHFGENFAVMESIQKSADLKPFLSKIHPISRRGQHFIIQVPVRERGL